MESSEAALFTALMDRHYAADDATRKQPSYVDVYTRLLHGRRESIGAVLELGVSSGASLLCWQDYLPNATIVGVDVAEPPAAIAGQPRIRFVRGSQDDPLTLDAAARAAAGTASEASGGRFDLIIDDASHIGYLTKRSLHYLFPRWLAPGGCYVIEDFGTGFLPEYPDGIPFSPPDWTDAQPGMREFRGSQFGMVGVIKQLVDHLMQELATGAPSYLAIEQLIVESNIALVRKSVRPGGAWPGYIADAPVPRPIPPHALEVMRETERIAAAQAEAAQAEAAKAEAVGSARAGTGDAAAPAGGAAGETEAALRARLDDHAARLAELERVVARLRRYAAPLLWLRRGAR